MGFELKVQAHLSVCLLLIGFINGLFIIDFWCFLYFLHLLFESP